MMYSLLWKHQWKNLVRSKYFSQGWGMKILIGFLVLYFGLSFSLLGFFMPELLQESFPSAEVLVPIYAQFVLYYMLSDLALRFFLQELNVMSIQHYLLQAMPKSKVINFLLGTSVFNLFNFFPLLFIVPFCFRVSVDELGITGGLLWMFSLLFFVFFNHFLAIYLKRVAAVKQWIFIVFAVVVATLFALNFAGWISLNDWSAVLFANLGQWWFFLIPVALTTLLYLSNYSFLRKQAYIDQWRKESKEASTQEFGYLESKGSIGVMIANELKLILRNKRTKSVLVITLLFSLYGLLFYTQPDMYDGMGWKVFVGIFMTGIFMINYGQFMVGWEGSFFDGILTRAYPMEAFFRAKFWLLVGSSLITYILSLGYMYFTIDALWINTAAFIYNVGVNSFVLLFASTYQKKRINLSKGSAFNYQGTSAVQFLVTIPLLVFPILIYQAFNVFNKPYYGLLALAVCGLLSLAFSKYWFREIIKNFNEKKYRNAAGFREG